MIIKERVYKSLADKFNDLCECPDPITLPDGRVLLVQRWCPETADPRSEFGIPCEVGFIIYRPETRVIDTGADRKG
jgi:hypothetical protein